MQGISDIRITGIDELRPPKLRKEPYINLFFKLSHAAPPAWCEDFNRLTAKDKYPARLDPAEGLFIETWVRKPEEIPIALEHLKRAVRSCSEQLIARLEADALAVALAGQGATVDEAQMHLNEIVAKLDFSD